MTEFLQCTHSGIFSTTKKNHRQLQLLKTAPKRNLIYVNQHSDFIPEDF